MPEGLAPETVPPLMCAGITTYSPLKFYGVGPGKKVGVAGLGGLGHVAVQLAAAMGAEVTVFSSTPEKEADAKRYSATALQRYSVRTPHRPLGARASGRNARFGPHHHPAAVRRQPVRERVKARRHGLRRRGDSAARDAD